MSQNLAADQDALVLHRQDQRLHRANVEANAVGNRRGWRKYYMATPSDVAVDAYRRWIDMAGEALLVSVVSILLGRLSVIASSLCLSEYTRGCWPALVASI